MPEDKLGKIDLALKEIGPCEIRVFVSPEGRIVKICKGRYDKPERHGVKQEVVIEEDITG